MPDPLSSKPPMPLSTYLIPVVLILVVGGSLLLSREAPKPIPPPGLRTPEGTGVPPSTVSPGTSVTEGAAPTSAPQLPKVVIYPGAEVYAYEPYYAATVNASFVEVRDYYLGAFGDAAQYTEATSPQTGLRRALIYDRTHPEETVQVSASPDPAICDLAIGTLEALTGRTPAVGVVE